jgi:hypothetical protein
MRQTAALGVKIVNKRQYLSKVLRQVHVAFHLIGVGDK